MKKLVLAEVAMCERWDEGGCGGTADEETRDGKKMTEAGKTHFGILTTNEE
jgi:hypothetical protein